MVNLQLQRAKVEINVAKDQYSTSLVIVNATVYHSLQLSYESKQAAPRHLQLYNCNKDSLDNSAKDLAEDNLADGMPLTRCHDLKTKTALQDPCRSPMKQRPYGFQLSSNPVAARMNRNGKGTFDLAGEKLWCGGICIKTG